MIVTRVDQKDQLSLYSPRDFDSITRRWLVVRWHSGPERGFSFGLGLPQVPTGAWGVNANPPVGSSGGASHNEVLISTGYDPEATPPPAAASQAVAGNGETPQNRSFFHNGVERWGSLGSWPGRSPLLRGWEAPAPARPTRWSCGASGARSSPGKF